LGRGNGGSNAQAVSGTEKKIAKKEEEGKKERGVFIEGGGGSVGGAKSYNYKGRVSTKSRTYRRQGTGS